MDLRETLTLAAGGGVGMACAASLALAGRPQAAAVEALDARVDAVAVRTVRPTLGPQVRLLANTPPLFPVLTGPGAAPEVAVRLDGVARTPQRVAALVGINGAPSAWLILGETRDGVTLEDVSASGVTVGTPRGLRTIVLGSGSPASPDSSAPAEAPMPGARGPLEPASAPSAKP